MPQPAANPNREENKGGNPQSPETRLSLRMTVASVFTLLILIFGASLVGFNYQAGKRITLLTTNDLLQRISGQVATQLAAAYNPIRNLVDITSRIPQPEIRSIEELLKSIDYLTEALQRNPSLSAIYMAYDDGDFFIVRVLSEELAALKPGEAPTSARYQIQYIDREENQVISEQILYLDAALKKLASTISDASDYDPRQRDWYQAAIRQNTAVTSDFYIFFTTREPGITPARRMSNGRGVVAVDLTLQNLSGELAMHKPTSSSEIILFDETGTVLAHSTGNSLLADAGASRADTPRLPLLSELPGKVSKALGERFNAGEKSGQLRITREGKDWLVSLLPIHTRMAKQIYLAALVPEAELLAGIGKVRDQGLMISGLLVVLAIITSLWIARSIAQPLQALSSEAKKIREFQLDTPLTLRSRIREVDGLANTMSVMKTAIQHFLAISKALSGEKNYHRLLDMILKEALSVSRADGGAILLLSEDEAQLHCVISNNLESGVSYGGITMQPPPYAPHSMQSTGNAEAQDIDSYTIQAGKPVGFDDIAERNDYRFNGVVERFEQQDYRVKSMLNVPLVTQKGDIIGLIQLVNARDTEHRIIPFDNINLHYIEALCSNAAVALDNRRLLQSQKDLLDAFIQIIAGAIDAKSPYTAGHCQRVPALAGLLAQAAQDTQKEPFSDFSLSEEEQHALYIASWLHDCGKVTTPEYVVDKATKLETIYNRIHEIRTRFEVLWRDAELAYYQDIVANRETPGILQARLEQRRADIVRDFAFIAKSNLGGEFLAQEDIDRIAKIGSQTWLRHLDDTLGLSEDELQRKRAAERPGDLPVEEYLLADKTEHLVARKGDADPFKGNLYGFTMEIPAYESNLGELHNLSIQRGTLTDEERFRINQHITQTIAMLKQLPFPKDLRKVPDWAGNHHEKMDGTGYPRSLRREDLSMPERIMAVADIFEALTASDRPYKKPKTLNEALRIMSFMRNDGHVCPDVFELFLTSGVFQRYAEQFLSPAQIDQVNVADYLVVNE